MTRPDARRALLLLAGLFVASVGLTSMASAQAAPLETPGTLVQGIVAPASHDVTASPIAADAAPDVVEAVASRTVSGPRQMSAAVTYTPRITAELNAVSNNEMPLNRPPTRNNAALIIVGISAMVIGSFVDDTPGDIIVLGGAGFTIYGIWQYLK